MCKSIFVLISGIEKLIMCGVLFIWGVLIIMFLVLFSFFINNFFVVVIVLSFVLKLVVVRLMVLVSEIVFVVCFVLVWMFFCWEFFVIRGIRCVFFFMISVFVFFSLWNLCLEIEYRLMFVFLIVKGIL